MILVNRIKSICKTTINPCNQPHQILLPLSWTATHCRLWNCRLVPSPHKKTSIWSLNVWINFLGLGWFWIKNWFSRLSRWTHLICNKLWWMFGQFPAASQLLSYPIAHALLKWSHIPFLSFLQVITLLKFFKHVWRWPSGQDSSLMTPPTGRDSWATKLPVVLQLKEPVEMWEPVGWDFDKKACIKGMHEWIESYRESTKPGNQCACERIVTVNVSQHPSASFNVRQSAGRCRIGLSADFFGTRR